MTIDREGCMLGICAIVLAGASYPSMTIERDAVGELKYFGEDCYDTQTDPVEAEEVQEVEEAQAT
jgi:hypothetical protein